MFADYLFYFLKQFILIFVNAISIAMFVRAIISWFDPMKEMKISYYLFVLTEPVIMPLRKLCERMHWFEGSPLDVPFFMTFLVLMLIELLVSSL